MVKIMNKILIIDDQKPIRNALREILEFEKYDVDEASEGRMALKMIKNYPYDLIFSCTFQIIRPGYFFPIFKWLIKW